MDSDAVLTRGSMPDTAVLAGLAERWRPVGLYLACLDRDGNLVWHDSQMPRAFTLSMTADSLISKQVRKLAKHATPAASLVHGQLSWMQTQVIPIARRRKLTGWIAIVGRTEAVVAGSEEFARLAQRASVDAQTLATQAHRAPLVPAAMFGPLVRVAEHMHEDLQASTVASTELANVTEQLTSVYEEISLLYKISSGMRFSQRPQAFLDTVCREVQGI